MANICDWPLALVFAPPTVPMDALTSVSVHRQPANSIRSFGDLVDVFSSDEVGLVLICTSHQLPNGTIVDLVRKARSKYENIPIMVRFEENDSRIGNERANGLPNNVSYVTRDDEKTTAKKLLAA